MNYSLRFALVLAIAAFFALAVYNHLFNVNSHYYYTWTWQWIASRRVYPLMIPLAIPFFIGQWVYARRPDWKWAALALCMVSMLALMIAGAALQKNPTSLSRISDVVQSRWSTGFFAEAKRVHRGSLSLREFLSEYPRLLPNFYIHPRQKPPGPILIELAIIRLFGEGQTAAMLSGLLIGIGGILSVVAIDAFIQCLTGNRDAAFFGASYFALAPSPVLFFPQFDQCYPILTCGIILLGALCLRKNQARYSVGLGLFFAAAAFITPLPGVLIFFLAGLAFLFYRADAQCTFGRILRHFVISVGAFAAFFVVLWMVTGFNPVTTLAACAHQVNVIWHILNTVYGMPQHHLPGTIPADLYDFALGSGWISYALVCFYLVTPADEGSRQNYRIAVLCVAQFVIIALIGLLQTEASRVWLFLFPMLMLPIGLELASWRRWQRTALYAALLILTITMCQSMQFMGTAQ